MSSAGNIMAGQAQGHEDSFDLKTAQEETAVGKS
jgi:hypothetical protein